MFPFVLILLACFIGPKGLSVAADKITAGNIAQRMDRCNDEVYDVLADPTVIQHLESQATEFRAKLKLLKSKTHDLWIDVILSRSEDESYEYLKAAAEELDLTMLCLSDNSSRLEYFLPRARDHYKLAIRMIVEYKRSADMPTEADEAKAVTAEKW